MFPADARENLENLKDFGFDEDFIKVQKNCHTKGIIVDRKRVMLGSQNWSNDGVSLNRDASLLFEDVPLAKYFGDIFEHDWTNLARHNIGSEALPIESVAASEATPPGMIRLHRKTIWRCCDGLTSFGAPAIYCLSVAGRSKKRRSALRNGYLPQQLTRLLLFQLDQNIWARIR